MFQFEHPSHFYALFLVPLVVGLAAWAFFDRQKRLAKLGQREAIERLSPDFSSKKIKWKTAFFCLGLGLLVVAWANPQLGTKREKVRSKSLDVFLALDISNSMLATDIQPSRLERAKLFCQKLLNELRGDRVGLIVFAGNAYLQMPLTNDFAAATLFLQTANPSMAPTQGTAIGDAIELAEKSFDRDGDKGGHALVLLTDGEDHDSDALDQAEKAADDGLAIFPIGVGTAEGGQIPMDSEGGRLPDFKRDETGKIVVSKLDNKLIVDLAEAGKGKPFNLAQNGDAALAELKSQLDRLEKREREQQSFSEFESWFQWFLAVGLLILAVDFWLDWRRGKFIF